MHKEIISGIKDKKRNNNGLRRKSSRKKYGYNTSNGIGKQY